MRQLLPFLFLYMLIAAALQGCSPAPAREMLDHADSIFDNDLDAATLIIDSVERMPDLGERERMRAKLMRMRIEDRRYVSPTSDSLMKVLIEYYIEQGHESEMHPTVFYQAGRTYAELGDSPRALNYFKKSLKLLKKDENLYLQSCIHSQLTGLFLNHHMPANALSHAKMQTSCEEMLNDTRGVINAKILLAFVYRNLLMNDSAEFIYKELAPKVVEADDHVITSLYVTQTASFLNDTFRFAEADSLLNSVALCADTTTSTSISLILNKFDKLNNNQDSLEIRSVKMLADKNIYARQNAYRNLANIYHSRGDSGNALRFTEKYRAVNESIATREASMALNGANELFDNTELEEENDGLLSTNSFFRKGWLWTALILGGVCIIAVSRYYIIKRKSARTKRELEKANGELQSNLDDETKTKKSLEENVATLNSRIEEYRQQNENSLVKADILIKDILHNAGNEGFQMNDSDFNKLEKAMLIKFPSFMSRLLELHLDQRSYKDAMLIKIGVSQKNCANIFNRTAATIANSRSRLMKKLSLDKDYKSFPDFIQSL